MNFTSVQCPHSILRSSLITERRSMKIGLGCYQINILSQLVPQTPNLIVKRFTTIWKGVGGKYEELNYPAKQTFTICRNESMKLESRSEFILQIGIYDAYVIDADGNRTSIHEGGNVISCQGIPPGEYDLLLKTEYEPSNDGIADFIGRIKII